MHADIILTPPQLRQIDSLAVSELGLPSIVLMENAGRHVADWMLDLGVTGEVVIAAGKGNNGGDGYVIARQLMIRGCRVRVVSGFPPASLTGDALVNARAWERLGGRIQLIEPVPGGARWNETLAGADWIVDALLGTGFSGQLRPPYAEAIAAINQHQSNVRVMAVDLPSGLDASTPHTDGPIVRADFTATFVAMKPGFAQAQKFLGHVRVFDIGVPFDWAWRSAERPPAA